MRNVAINGFGRIGRAYFRLAFFNKDINIVAINDLTDVEALAYLLQYDTVHGKFRKSIKVKGNFLLVDGKEIQIFCEKDPKKLPWGSLGIDTVIESTGVFTSYERASVHIKAGARRVIISAPVKDEPPEGIQADTVLIGVNTERAKTCSIVSNASCTTNSVGIPMKALNSALGIDKAILNTVHAYTASQKLVDSVSKKSLRFGRSAQNIVPTTTGAAFATTKVLKELEGKFDGIALRVPVISGSIADVTFVSKRDTTVEEVNKVLEQATNNLFTVTKDPIVSSDVIGEKYVSIADLSLTRVVDGNLVKVMLWYDNEFGYTQSLIQNTLL